MSVIDRSLTLLDRFHCFGGVLHINLIVENLYCKSIAALSPSLSLPGWVVDLSFCKLLAHAKTGHIARISLVPWYPYPLYFFKQPGDHKILLCIVVGKHS